MQYVIRPLCWSVLLIAVCATSPASAQEQDDATTPMNMQQADEGQPPMGEAAPEMREMAKSMKSMADMCRTMMEREMRDRPIKLTAIVALGTLLTLALVLFIVLEILWIRFWSLRIKSERKALGR